MNRRIILASGSPMRAAMLRSAGVVFDVINARVDEDAIRASLLADRAKPHDVADALAEMKARKVAEKHPDALVIGADQVLDISGTVLAKPETTDQARTQLISLRGQTHRLLSAVVIYENARPVWRHTGITRLTMRDFSDTYLSGYLDRNWHSVRHSVGAYKIEEEGSRLMSRIEGDHFTILGLPLVELLTYLTLRGYLET